MGDSREEIDVQEIGLLAVQWSSVCSCIVQMCTYIEYV